MALAANALTTVATMTDELGASTLNSTAALERAINTASGAIEKFCDRKFYREVITLERVAGYGTQKLLLSRRPIVSVQAVTIEDVTVDASEYVVPAVGSEDADAGVLFRRAGWTWTARLQADAPQPHEIAGTEEKAYLVSYTAGYVLPSAVSGRDLPYDLEHACIIAAASIFRSKGKYSKLVSMSADGEQRPWYDYVLPPNARALLAPYKRIF